MRDVLKNTKIKPKNVIIIFILHALLAVVATQSTDLIKLYSVAIVLFGCQAALAGKRIVVACVAAYLVGAEVFWRMADAVILWEFAKYGIVVIFLMEIIIEKKKSNAVQSLIIYMLLLLPAVSLAGDGSFGQWRRLVSFNLSGPLSLLVSGLYFSRLRLNLAEVKKIFLSLLYPIISISALILINMRGVSQILWGTASNRITSGGFGPNQVSAILGLGTFICIILFLSEKKGVAKNIFLVLALCFFAQSLLTFSRGGSIGAVISILVFFVILVQNSKYFMKTVVAAIVIGVLSVGYLIPKLDELTEGGLSKRYGETETVGNVEVYETTGRWELIQVDLKAFRENIFGIGVGNSKQYHEKEAGKSLSAHTEWSRLLAEHGLLGLAAIFFLLLWLFHKYKNIKDHLFKAIIAACIINATFYMFCAAMRTAAPGFLLGLTGILFYKDELNKSDACVE
jgi:O-antigen ligase/polysaccharide polymerase Wzy-like membrane protein